MSRRRRMGLRVLKAVSSSIRLQILNFLFNMGPLSYTKIMSLLGLSPSQDAGKFAYHLKSLLKADLVELDVKPKKYRLTDLGRMVIDVAEDIEERVSKRRKLLVRTSRLAMEEFDRNKITESLVREASIPPDLAQKIARETEERLLEFKTKYLTAPLIRELVNAVLIEKGLEEYRHKLTRLGLPVYDVTQLIRETGAASLGVEAVHKAAGDAVIEEYTLLTVLPRDVADAHLSGTLHLSNLGCWVLKPHEFMHDLRFFLAEGLNLGRSDFTGLPSPPPKSLESALLTSSNLLKIAATEASGEQTIDFFNVFLAPFVKGLPEDRIKEGLRFFVYNLNQSLSEKGFPVEASLGLELVIPNFLKEEEAVGPGGKTIGSYGDFVEEGFLIASLLLEVMSEGKGRRSLFNPSLIIKVRPEVLKSTECDHLLLQSHRLAAKSGTPYFANLLPKKQKYSSYAATGCRFAADWKEDWELDTLRTASVDGVSINLPRTAYDAEGSRSRFFELLDERLEMALRALEIKYQKIRQRVKEGLLPFLAQKAGADYYFRIENASRPVGFVGLNEMVKVLSGGWVYETEEALGLAEDIMSHVLRSVRGRAERPEARVVPSMTLNANAGERLAKLDVEKYGWAKVHAQGSRERPFYTDMVAVPLEASVSWRERLSIEETFHRLAPGGHLAVIQLADLEQDPEELLSATRSIVKTYDIGLYTYSRNLAYCSRCRETFYGTPSKCPICSSVNMLVCFSRVYSKYLAVSRWAQAKRFALNERASYVLKTG